MRRLILTTSDSGGGNLKVAGIADLVVPFSVELVWGAPPSAAELAKLVADRPTERAAGLPNWIDVVSRRQREAVASKGLG
jgi:hypothetical protein